jgi:hypothetical protein
VIEEEMMVQNLNIIKFLQVLTGAFGLIAAAAGAANLEMYTPVVSARIIPGVLTQDIIVIIASALLIVLALSMKARDYRKLIISMGALGFLFYAYGIYAFEQVYTGFYLIYLAILGLSFYGLITALGSLEKPEVERLSVPAWLGYGSAGLGILIALMFNFLWISELLPLMATGDRIEYTFSVYVIDLVFIMPGFVIAGLLSLRGRAFGLIGLPGLFIVGVGILAPLALAELLKPALFSQPMDPGGLGLFGTLTLLFLAFAAAYLVLLRPADRARA